MIGVYFRTKEKTQHTPAPRERGGGGQKGEKERGQEKESVRQRKKKEGGQRRGKNGFLNAQLKQQLRGMGTILQDPVCLLNKRALNDTVSQIGKIHGSSNQRAETEVTPLTTPTDQLGNFVLSSL